MKINNKIFSVILSLFLVPLMPMTAFASSNHNENINIPEISDIVLENEGNYEYVFTGKETKRDVGIGYHPDFKKREKAAFYYFSSSKQVNLSISGTIYGTITGKVDASVGSSAGYGVEADSSRWSRPYIYGDLTIYNYNLIIKDDVGNIINVVKVKESKASNTYIKAVYN